MKHIPGVDMSSGSLGQGTSVSCGMALAGKIDTSKGRKLCFVISGGNVDADLYSKLIS